MSKIRYEELSVKQRALCRGSFSRGVQRSAGFGYKRNGGRVSLLATTGLARRVDAVGQPML
jgi:hypothetical protein